VMDGRYLFVAAMASYVGLNPERDIRWLTHPAADAMRLLGEGNIDAFLGFPPEPLELRERKIGHPVVSTTVDRPWSQYFCCMVAANTEFVRKNPVGTKRALRAIFKAAERCAVDPDGVARMMVDRGFSKRHDWTARTLKELPYNVWRTHDPEDTIRFYSLRLREAGLVRMSPQNVLRRGTDWRFVNELRQELKG
jgi:NitT/TauT family transport system substrate-binding protein